MLNKGMDNLTNGGQKLIYCHTILSLSASTCLKTFALYRLQHLYQNRYFGMATVSMISKLGTLSQTASASAVFIKYK